MMKKAIAALLLTVAGAVAAPAAETSPLEAFGKAIAVALLSNDLVSVTNAYVQPESPFVAEIVKSWRKTREMGDFRLVQWTTSAVSGVRIKKLVQQADRRIADVLVDVSDGKVVFTIFLDECYEVNNRWFLGFVKWRDGRMDDGTTTGRTVPPSAGASGGQ